ncbi:hypothetical protein C1645_813938 [Glomus cerebriforme]|uniref:BTB/POZ domain-containing protein n=1 Tax=Glomus cerebriforme TaxID=658196 RepID=A0A397THM3_9GLOM|nr:hypothetical protein C1645_813938 [Glomus cerebriforme]
MTFEFFQEISNDYEKLLENEKGYDVIIYAGEDNNLKEIHAHSLVLCTRSRYFCAAFSNEWVEKKDGKFIFKKPNISPELFKIILRFIYCGKIDLTNLKGHEILELLMVVDELDIQTLISCIQIYIIKNQKFLQENIMEILQIVYQNELFTGLLDCCLENIEMIFDSDEFINLEEPLLEFLLDQDDLNLDEIEVWNGLIKWGLAQEQEFNQNISEWNQDDFDNLKNIIQKFIPLIRFYDISSQDYFNKVKPYEKILSEELREEILKFHLVPGYKPQFNYLPRRSIDSILINQKHVTLFANWIDKTDENTKYRAGPYKFNLLYRASRDGNTNEAFHEKCDNKESTITVVKIKDSEQIVGGYNPFEWDSNDVYKPTEDSFIFSLKDRTNLQTAKVGYSNGDHYSIICHSYCGPLFGYNDLFVNSGVWYSVPVMHGKQYSYPRLDDMPSSSFKADDYEVFQVVKRPSKKNYYVSIHNLLKILLTIPKTSSIVIVPWCFPAGPPVKGGQGRKGGIGAPTFPACRVGSVLTKDGPETGLYDLWSVI